MPLATGSRPSPLPTSPAKPVEVSTARPTTWDDIARSTARMAVRTPDPQKADVLRAPGDRTPALCGPRPSAILIDTATLGASDYLYVGALHTMGFEIVLTSRAKTLPVEQVRGLAKQGIAAPVPGKTLFPSPPGAEAAARKTIASQYCIVGLVGNRAADFPGGALPGTPQARDGWYLVTKP